MNKAIKAPETDLWIVVGQFTYGGSGIVFRDRKTRKPLSGGSKSLVEAPAFFIKKDALKLARQARMKKWVKSAWIQRIDILVC